MQDKPKKTRMPKVSEELEDKWLEEKENGKPVSKIAKEHGCDQRTVSSHIENALRRREAARARATALLNSLESHHRDLLKYAGKVREATSSESQIEAEVLDKDYGKYLWQALRQHLGRSPLERYISIWNELIPEIAELEKTSISNIDDYVAAKSAIIAFFKNRGVPEILAAIMKQQLYRWSRGHTGSELKKDFKVKKLEDGMAEISYGPARGTFAVDIVEDIRQSVNELETDLKNWLELKDLKDLRGKLTDTRTKIWDEVATIQLKKILPGRCKYCPV